MYGICGLYIETTGLDPLTSRISQVRLALPNGRVYMADIFNLGLEIFDDLAALVEDTSGQISDWRALEPPAEQTTSAAKYAEVLLPLQAVLHELLIKNGLKRVAELEFGTISPVVEMELSGIYLDADAARALILEKEARMVEAFMDIQEEAKRNGFIPMQREGKRPCKYLNPDSQEDVKRYLQSRCFNITSTRAEVLRELAMGGNIFAEAGGEGNKLPAYLWRISRDSSTARHLRLWAGDELGRGGRSPTEIF